MIGTIPPEYAWIIPLLVPLIVGLLIGVILRHTVRLVFPIAALAILLVFMGYVSLTFQDVYDKAMMVLPVIIDMGSGLKNVLPYSSMTFLVGLALGLWKG